MRGLKAKCELVMYLFLLKVIINKNIGKYWVYGENQGKKKKFRKIYKDIVEVLSFTPGIIRQKMSEGKLNCREATN